MLLGTSSGQLVLLSSAGDQRALISLNKVGAGVAGVVQLAWNCPRFRHLERLQEDIKSEDTRGWVLAVALSQGTLLLLRDGPEDPVPRRIATGLIGLKICWNEAGSLLAVAGFVRCANLECACWLRLYPVDTVADAGTALQTVSMH